MQQNVQEQNTTGKALFIVPEREIEGFDHYGPGISLGHSNQAKINAICKRLGVAPLSSFFSQDTDALSGHLRYEGYAPPDLPALSWFSATDGLETVQALAAHLEANPEIVEGADAMIEELREYEFVLARFEKEGIRWYMSAGF